MRGQTSNDPFVDLLRPFAWISLAAFVLGFALVLAAAAPRWAPAMTAGPERETSVVAYPATPAEGRRAI